MLKIDTTKKYFKIALSCITAMIFLFTFNEIGYTDSDSKVGAKLNRKIENIVQVISEDEPLAIPQDFIETLKNMGITGITLGDKQGRIRLVTVDGNYVNPCNNTEDVAANPTTNSEDIRPCLFVADLGEAHLLIGNRLELAANEELTRAGKLAPTGSSALAAGCGTCQAGGVSRVCYKATNKYTCTTKANFCQTSCI
jgi:hypothetical protein